MNKLRISIGQKILAANILLLVIFIFNAVFVSVKLIDNKELIERDEGIVNPSIAVLGEFKHIITKSKLYTANWLYLDQNTESKESLRKLHAYEFLAVKNEITRLKHLWKNKEEVAKMDSILVSFYDNILLPQKQIMSLQLGSRSYLHKSVNIEKSYINKIKPYSDLLIVQIDGLISIKKNNLEGLNKQIAASTTTIRNTAIFLVFLWLIIMIISAFIIKRLISKPIKYINALAVDLAKGKIPDLSVDKFKFNNDEIGDIAISMSKLMESLKMVNGFAKNIGEGTYDSEFRPLSEYDTLGGTLLSMRKNLIKVADESETQNWVSSGIAKFAEILRENHDDLDAFYYTILFNLVKYLNANQGGIFIIEEQNDTTETALMRLESCYAWDKKKYREKLFKIGEGLAGQSWLEKETIYLTDIPQEHIKITSGLGKKKPKCILITPIVFNNVIHGVIEIASFQELKAHEIKFVEQVSELFASTLATVKINQKTKVLLSESTFLTEQLRTQEEELRQNMEELQATQEEMRRSQKELLDKDSETQNLLKGTESQNGRLLQQEEKMKVQVEELRLAQQIMKKTQIDLNEYKSNLDGLINNTEDTIFAIDGNYNITVINKTLQDRMLNDGISVGIGNNVLDILPDSLKEFWKEKYDRALDGEMFSFPQERAVKEGKIHIQISLNPIIDSVGNVVGASVISRDVTASKEQEFKIQELLEGTRQGTRKIQKQKDFYDTILAFVNGTMYRCVTRDEDNWQFEYISKGIYELTGYTEKDFIELGKTFSDITHPDDKERVDEEIEANDSEFSITYRIITNSNAVRWVSETGMKILDRDSGEMLAIGFIYDITETKKQERRMTKARERLEKSEERSNRLLRESREQNVLLEIHEKEMEIQEAKLNSIINSTNASIIAVNIDYSIILINEVQKKRYKGTQYEGVDVGENVLDMLGDVKKEWKGYYDKALGGEQFNFVISTSVRGEEGFREYFINPMKNESDEVIGISVFSTDVTQAKLNEIHNQELINDLQEQTQALRSQEEELLAQEEELRQNLEEMLTTNDRLLKVQDKLSEERANINAIVNNTDASIIAIDTNYIITLINETQKRRYVGTQYEATDVGENVLDMLGKVKMEWKGYYDKGFAGEQFDFVIKSSVNREESFRHYHINPIRNEKVIIGLSVFSTDVTQEKRNEAQNQDLINDLREQTEALRIQEEELLAQEEALRQNLEEMVVTNERLATVQDELEHQQVRLTAIINNTDASIIAIDTDYVITLVNDTQQKRYLGTQYEGIGAGKNVLDLLGDVRQEWQEYYDKGLAGEQFDFIIESSVKGENTYRHYYINPIRKEDIIVGLSVFSRDVTKEKTSEIQNEQLIKEIEQLAIQKDAEIKQLKKRLDNN